MIKALVIILGAAIVIILGLSLFLGPNDLASCGDEPSGASKCQKADAIVAISGGDTTARVNEAIRLYQAGWASKLIFSGAAQDTSGPSNAEVMQQIALDAGVPVKSIIIEEEGKTTKENAENTQDIFQQNDITSVILVTSAYHQRRASLEFNKRAAGTVQVRNHPVAADKQWSGLWWMTPTGWYLATTEFFKIMAFYVGGTR
jgi:uncharacterized SAM-binding protein YcdF (DUF218 family)